MTDLLVKASSSFLVNDMPTYHYKCESCGEEFSRTETMVEHTAKLVNCPKCDSDQVERMFSEFFAKTIRKS
jgi:putative FmdB family regulatory protein